MDSRIVLDAVLTSEGKPATLHVSRNATAATSLYWDGFHAYIEGQQLEDMPTKEQRRGWWAGLEGQANAETSAWLAAQLEELVDGMDDNEWFSRGQW